MAFEIAVKSTSPPDRMLYAIRENLRECRESKIPRDVWNDGLASNETADASARSRG